MEVTVRELRLADYAGLKATMIEAYQGQGSVWREANIEKLLDIFPEGQLCVLVDGKVAACALSIRVQYEFFGDEHTYEEITGNYTFDTHFEHGDTLYGIEVFVHPEFRELRLGRRLRSEERRVGKEWRSR